MGIDLPVKRTIQKVLRTIMQHDDAGLYFNEPVDAEALRIPEYYKIIKRPMDLGNIMRRVNNDEYTEVHEVYLDIMQVWRNCFKFNKNFSKPYKAGLHLKALSESTWKGYGLAVSSRGQTDLKKGTPTVSSVDLQGCSSEDVGKKEKVRGGDATKEKPKKKSTDDAEPEAEDDHVSILKSLSKKGVAPPPGHELHGKKGKKGHHQPHPNLFPVPGPSKLSSPQPPKDGMQLGRLLGKMLPPLPGGLNRLPKRKRTGGHGDPSEIVVGFSGDMRILKKLRSRAARSPPAPPKSEGKRNQGLAMAAGRGKGPRKGSDHRVEKMVTLEAPRPPASAPTTLAPAPTAPKPKAPAHPLARLLMIIEKLLQKEEAVAFREPVNLQEVPDYLTMVSRPMDLGTIAEALRPGLRSGWGTVSYKSVNEVITDVIQVWENCKLYNDDSAPVRYACKRMEAMFRKYCDKYSIQLPENIPLSSPKFKATKEQPKKRPKPTVTENEAPQPGRKKRKDSAAQQDMDLKNRPAQQSAPRPPARIPNSKNRKQDNGQGQMASKMLELDEEGLLDEGLEGMEGDDLFSGFEAAPPDQERCSVCVKVKRGICGTLSSVLKCERRAKNGLPTCDDDQRREVEVFEGHEGEAQRMQQERRQAQREAASREAAERMEKERQEALEREREVQAARQREREVLAEVKRVAEAREREAALRREYQQRAVALKKEVEDPIRERTIRAAEMQQQAAAAKLKLRKERAEEAIGAATAAIQRVTAAKELLAELDALIHARHQTLLSNLATEVPAGCELMNPAVFQGLHQPRPPPMAVPPASLLRLGDSFMRPPGRVPGGAGQGHLRNT